MGFVEMKFVMGFWRGLVPRVPLVPQELWVHPFGGDVAVSLGLLDSIPVSLVRLVVSGVILRFRHCSFLSAGGGRRR